MFQIFKNLFASSNNQQLEDAIKKGAFLVDVRTSGEFASGSVKSAVNIPLDKIHNHLDRFKGKKDIIVFCRTGNRSSHAKSILEQNGFKNIINGGSWQDVNQYIIK
jgi:rhodanese-related sulfurtransferase